MYRREGVGLTKQSGQELDADHQTRLDQRQGQGWLRPGLSLQSFALHQVEPRSLDEHAHFSRHSFRRGQVGQEEVQQRR